MTETVSRSSLMVKSKDSDAPPQPRPSTRQDAKPQMDEDEQRRGGMKQASLNRIARVRQHEQERESRRLRRNGQIFL